MAYTYSPNPAVERVEWNHGNKFRNGRAHAAGAALRNFDVVESALERKRALPPDEVSINVVHASAAARFLCIGDPYFIQIHRAGSKRRLLRLVAPHVFHSLRRLHSCS